eukprot:497730-Lingulodinium_polyedra.AAC.1
MVKTEVKTTGKWRLAHGKWQLANGERRMAMTMFDDPISCCYFKHVLCHNLGFLPMRVPYVLACNTQNEFQAPDYHMQA